jgi:hypothetical protein
MYFLILGLRLFSHDCRQAVKAIPVPRQYGIKLIAPQSMEL